MDASIGVPRRMRRCCALSIRLVSLAKRIACGGGHQSPQAVIIAINKNDIATDEQAARRWSFTVATFQIAGCRMVALDRDKVGRCCCKDLHESPFLYGEDEMTDVYELMCTN